MILWIVLLTQTGHLLSPMALAWSHDGFRALMLRRRIKFIVIPVAVPLMAAAIGFVGGRALPNLRFDPNSFALAAGPTTLAEFKNPFMAMVALYAAWNAFHFGMQAFGVMSIYRRLSTDKVSTNALNRQIDKLYCCTVVWAAMAMPFIPRIAEGIHKLTGWPAHPHPFLGRVQWFYLAWALAGISLMLWREWRTGRSLPRALFILTDGLALILIFHAGLWGFAIIGLNHWLVAIGLASHVYANSRSPQHYHCPQGCEKPQVGRYDGGEDLICGRCWFGHTRVRSVAQLCSPVNCGADAPAPGSPWPFAMAVMGMGFVLFCVLFFDPANVRAHGLSTAALSFTATAVGFRLGLGFWHFLTDRALYQFHRPEVRATIGADMLRSRRPLIIEPFPAIAAE